MAVNKDPILKRCRYLGISPMVMGINKSSNRNPNANSRRKVSEYGTQLKEKQKLKFIYGVQETPFRHYFELAEKMEGKAGDNLITLLESRLDNVAFRMGMALTRREARQLVSHGHFTVNGQRVDIPSYRVAVGDVIAVSEKSRQTEKFKALPEQTAGRTVPLWLDANKEAFSATVNRLPNPADIDYEAETHLIVELYSK
ncbi:MAG: 30S ribosomal protein S4 [Oscillospiraceae bacterium]|nr:30S ribosomal protein S4 [Oscillospiraceae bacterium]MBR1898005.1 30S ribosomal protein S4 [Oscillospiraceae bacterium]